jgi:hypothetical protein
MNNDKSKMRRDVSAWVYCAGACILGGWLAAHEVPIIPTFGGILVGVAIMMRLGWLMERNPR